VVKCPAGPSNSRLYGGNVKSNALGFPGGGGLIAVGFDSYITPRYVRRSMSKVELITSAERLLPQKQFRELSATGMQLTEKYTFQANALILKVNGD
jgi:hypothetical protein